MFLKNINPIKEPISDVINMDKIDPQKRSLTSDSLLEITIASENLNVAIDPRVATMARKIAHWENSEGE